MKKPLFVNGYSEFRVNQVLMEEDLSFVVVRDLGYSGFRPTSVCMCYPVMVIVESDRVVCLDIESGTSNEIEALGNDILCSSISNDKIHFSTGHANGNVSIWSIKSKSRIISFSFGDPIGKIAFGCDKNTVFHTNSSGVVTMSVMTSYIVKKVFSNRVIHTFDAPLTTLATHHDYLFVSSTDGTIAFKIKDTISVAFSDSYVARSFSFLNSELVARGVDQSVILSDFVGNLYRIINFSYTPQHISLMSSDIVYILFDGFCELSAGGKRCRREIVKGKPVVHESTLYIVNQSIYCITLSPIEDRIMSYIKSDNWDKALSMLDKNIDKDWTEFILNQYFESPSFSPFTIINTVDRIDFSNYITDFKFPEIYLKDIMYSFVSSNIKQWALNHDFIKSLCLIIDDLGLLTSFLERIDIHYSWLAFLIDFLISKHCFESLEFILNKYVYDEQLKLVVFAMNQKWELCLRIVQSMLIEKQKLIESLFQIDIYEFIDISGDRINESLCELLNYTNDIDFLEYLIHNTPLNSTLWIPLINKVKQLKYEQLYVTNLLDFISYGKDDLKEFREEILVWLFDIGLVQSLPNLSIIAESLGFNKFLSVLVLRTKSVPELITFLLSTNQTTFIYYFTEFGFESEVLCLVLKKYSLELMFVNIDEFVSVVLRLSSRKDLFDPLVTHLKENWQFMKCLFGHNLVYELVEDDIILGYIRMNCMYAPCEVVKILKQSVSLPIQETLEILRYYGNIEGMLYIYNLQNDENGIQCLIKAIIEDCIVLGSSESNINQIMASLSEYRISIATWLSFIGSLRFFVHMNDQTDRLYYINKIIFSQMLKIVAPKEIMSKIIEILSPYPLSHIKPIINSFIECFNREKEEKQFLESVQKKHNTLIQANLIIEENNGRIVDSSKCIYCNQRITNESFVVFPCNHAIHQRCNNSWCPKCNKTFEKSEYNTIDQHFDIYDRLVSIHRIPMQQKPKKVERNIKPKPLETPKIGILY